MSRVPATRRSVADALAHRLLRIGKGFLHFCLYIFLMRVFFFPQNCTVPLSILFTYPIFFLLSCLVFYFWFVQLLRPIIDDPVPYAGLMPFFVFTTYTPANFFLPNSMVPYCCNYSHFPFLVIKRTKDERTTHPRRPVRRKFYIPCACVPRVFCFFLFLPSQREDTTQIASGILMRACVSCARSEGIAHAQGRKEKKSSPAR